MPLGYYDVGATPFFALQADQRVSYCLYVPRALAEAQDRSAWRLIVAMHGTGRTATTYRDKFADLAERERCIVLAPLFPVGLIEPEELSNYKRLKFHDMRFDLLLLAMVDEVGRKYGIDVSRFLLFGFSGGGQFVHRVFLLHPHRLAAVSIGAPGNVTLLDDTRDWWVGTRNLQAELGADVDLAAMRHVPVHMVVGAEDTETWEITLKPHHSAWMEGANDAGRTRIDRLATLKANYEQHGIAVRHDIVPGIGHEGWKTLEPVIAFFTAVLQDGAKRSGA
ncbi:alpha/beta hydrolase [Vineibacter terrae]|uniref:alpha/beta hydrolase n=1 Tax=Vineibacter terrae TaxID=2586908 RepID=UPI002E2F76B2|nr:alpha/beta hydrolase [Vineibacter terrae]HEX2889824.1 alpha/beta hydrolase [Vineibacter terrae]